MNTQVLIVGAGPVGLTMALQLTRLGVSVRIIDQEKNPHTESRAMALHSRTLEIYEKMGILDDILAKGIKAHFIQFHINNKLALKVDYSKINAPYPYYVLLPQSDTEEVINNHLQQHKVLVERNAFLQDLEPEDTYVKATIINDREEEEVINYQYVIGCDGAHSQVRKALDIGFEGFKYTSHFLLADVKMHWAKALNSIYGYSYHDGNIMFFPISELYTRVVVQISEKKSKSMQNFSDLKAYLRKKMSEPIDFLDVKWISPFKVSHRIATRFRNDRVFLAGDAAHIHSPLGGQGLNTGVQDAYNLAWKLGLVLNQNAKSDILLSYSRERKPVALSVLKSTNRMTKIITLSGRLFINIRLLIMKLVNPMSFIKLQMANHFSGIKVSYKNSPIIKKSYNILPGLEPGDRLPDAHLQHGQSRKQQRLFKLLDDLNHHLLIFSPDYQRAKVVLDQVEVEHLGLVKAHIILSNEHSYDALIDQEGKLRKKLGSNEYILVRPDGYIAAMTNNLQDLEEYYKNIFFKS